MKYVAFILVLSILSAPLSYSTEVNEYQQAIMDARADALKDFSSTEWLMLGCCLGVFGYVVSLASTEEIPVDRFIGKSPEYVYFYSEEYQRKSTQLKTDSAFGGMMIMVLIAAVTSFFLSQSQLN